MHQPRSVAEVLSVLADFGIHLRPGLSVADVAPDQESEAKLLRSDPRLRLNPYENVLGEMVGSSLRGRTLSDDIVAYDYDFDYDWDEYGRILSETIRLTGRVARG